MLQIAVALLALANAAALYDSIRAYLTLRELQRAEFGYVLSVVRITTIQYAVVAAVIIFADAITFANQSIVVAFVDQLLRTTYHSDQPWDLQLFFESCLLMWLMAGRAVFRSGIRLHAFAS